MTIKNKLSDAVNHVKAHPTPYIVIATATVTLAAAAYAEQKFLRTERIVSLTRNAALMRENHKGLYFNLKDGGRVIMYLEEFLDAPLDLNN